jgi:hypothetical protein
VKTACPIWIKIRNRLATPKIDGQFIIRRDICTCLTPSIKKRDFVISLGGYVNEKSREYDNCKHTGLSTHR